MRRYSPPYRSPPRRGYSGGGGGRGRSPPRRGYGGRREQGSGSLLVRNIPLSCRLNDSILQVTESFNFTGYLNFGRAEDIRVPFERFGPVRDVYLPKDYYTGEPRGFAFVEFVDPYDASEAQYHMNRQVFFGREITVVLAAESRKRPEEMRSRARVRGYSGNEGRRSYYGHTPLLQDGEMTIQLPHRERTRTQNLLGVSQKNMMETRSGDHTLLPVEMATLVMLITVMRRGRPHLTATDPLHNGGRPGPPPDRLLDHAPGPPMFLPPAATDRSLNECNGIAA
uniref:RRM domain-containing protein n=1 Tax=Leersia perrieri TaxID=77586 RepID=A0A0D9Y0M6_9ORYZ